MAINVKNYQSVISGAKNSVYFDPTTKARQAPKSASVQPQSKSKFELVKESLSDVERGHERRTSRQGEVPMPSVFKKV